MKSIRQLCSAFALVLAGTAAAADAPPPLALKIYNANAASFHVNSVLVSGPREAVLIDAQFTRADAHRLVADILASGRRLTAVYVSHGDPDYYFGLEVIQAEFPEAKIYASRPTIDWIRATVDKKLAFWGPKLGANAPRRPVIPEPLPATGLHVDGEALEVVGLSGEAPGRSFVWIPSIRAVVGGVNVFGDLHLWTADTRLPEQRAAWLRTLDRISALEPRVVVPGHAKTSSGDGIAAVAFSRRYLLEFERELGAAADAASLIARMKGLHPEAGLELALDIGARVIKGEMKW